METGGAGAGKTWTLARSDPTYEAWKHVQLFTVDDGNICSDPTYEAWKLFFLISSGFGDLRSDPTYEAWKR